MRKQRHDFKAKDQTDRTSSTREASLEILRQKASLARLEADWQAHSESARARSKLLALTPATFNLQDLQIAELIPRRVWADQIPSTNCRTMSQGRGRRACSSGPMVP